MRLPQITALLLFSLTTAFAGTPTDSNLKEPKGEYMEIQPYQKNSLIDIDSSNFKIAKSDQQFDHVVVSARLDASGVSVLYESKCVLEKDSLNKNFSVFVSIPKRTHETVIHLTIVDIKGRITNEKFWVRYKSLTQSEATNSSPTNWNLSLNTTAVKYIEGSTNYNSVALTPKAGVQHEFSNHLTLRADTSISILPITKNNSETMNILEMNALAGYIFPSNNSWEFGAFVGAYYLTTFVSDNSFGFNNLDGPEALLSVTKHYKKSSLSVYVKGAIVGDLSNLSAVDNHQIAGGVIYYFPMLKNKFSVNFDIAKTEVPLLNQNLELSTYSLGFGINF